MSPTASYAPLDGDPAAGTGPGAPRGRAVDRAVSAAGWVWTALAAGVVLTAAVRATAADAAPRRLALRGLRRG